MAALPRIRIGSACTPPWYSPAAGVPPEKSVMSMDMLLRSYRRIHLESGLRRPSEDTVMFEYTMPSCFRVFVLRGIGHTTSVEVLFLGVTTTPSTVQFVTLWFLKEPDTVTSMDWCNGARLGVTFEKLGRTSVAQSISDHPSLHAHVPAPLLPLSHLPCPEHVPFPGQSSHLAQ